MKKPFLFLTVIFLLLACKETRYEILDGPDDTLYVDLDTTIIDTLELTWENGADANILQQILTTEEENHFSQTR